MEIYKTADIFMSLEDKRNDSTIILDVISYNGGGEIDLNKDDAIKIIAHLKQVFELEAL